MIPEFIEKYGDDILLVLFICIVGYIIFNYTFSSFVSPNLTPTQNEYMTTTFKPIFDKIQELKEKYDDVANLVPNQVLLSVDASGQAVTTISPGDPKKLQSLKEQWKTTLGYSIQLNQLYKELIEKASKSTGVYTPERLKAFVTYYTILQTNVETVINYLNKTS
jgi:hypothetical protein